MSIGDDLTFASTGLALPPFPLGRQILSRNVPRGATVLGLQVVNASTIAFVGLSLFRGFQTDVTAIETVAENAGDFASTTANTPILESRVTGGGSPVTLGSSASWHCRLDVAGTAVVEVRALINGGGTAHVFGTYHYGIDD